MVICENCEKKGLVGNLVSHSHHKTKRRQRPNIQTVTINGQRIALCTKCIKRHKRQAKSKPKPKHKNPASVLPGAD